MLLIFDLDGTLYRTQSSFIPTMKEAYRQHGIPYPGDEAVLSKVGDTFSCFLAWLQEQGFEGTEEDLARDIATYEHTTIAEGGELYPGVETTLRHFKQNGYRLAICTNGDVPYTKAVLGKFDLYDQFDGIKTHGDAGQSKTEMIRELLDEFEPKCAFMIGDRHHDFIAGRATGCVVVATSYGFASANEAEDVDHRISEFQALADIVEMTREKGTG